MRVLENTFLVDIGVRQREHVAAQHASVDDLLLCHTWKIREVDHFASDKKIDPVLGDARHLQIQCTPLLER